MTDRKKLLVIAATLGDDAGVVIKPRSIEIPAWRRRFVFDGATGDIVKVQDVVPNSALPSLREYRTIGRVEGR